MTSLASLAQHAHALSEIELYASRRDMAARIVLLSGDYLVKLVDAIRETEPASIRYVDSEWDFDLEHLEVNTLLRIKGVLDDFTAFQAKAKSGTGRKRAPAKVVRVPSRTVGEGAV